MFLILFFEKYIIEKDHFAKFLKLVFHKMKSTNIDQWQLGYDYF